MNKEKIFRVIFIMIFIGCFLTLGWALNELYEILDYQRQLNGLYMRNYDYSSAKELAYDRDEYGDWVCINVRKMDYETAYEVCRHEISHEIFAENCESNITKCLEAIGE